MTLEPEKLTAYALGELSPDEADQVEAHLADHPEAQAELDAIRAAAANLENALHSEPIPSPSGAFKMTDHEQQPVRRRPTAALLWIGGGAIAAVIAIGLVLPSLKQTEETNGNNLQSDGRTVASPMTREEQKAIYQQEADRFSREVEKINAEWQALTANPSAINTEAFEKLDQKFAQLQEDKKKLEQLFGQLRTFEARPTDQSTAGPQPQLARGQKPSTIGAKIEPRSDRDSRGQIRFYAYPNPERNLGLAGDESSASDTRFLNPSVTGRWEGTPARPYTVAEGDSLASIAEAELGDRSQWHHIARLNQGRIANPDMIRPGQEILLPNIDRMTPPNDREAYDRIRDNPFRLAADHPLSTFSIDVDTASYANVRRFLSQGQLPPPDAVRIEEMVNYFSYTYDPPSPDSEHPFSADVEVIASPWSPQNKLVRIGLKGKVIEVAERPAANLVFLLDVSGSMNSHDKLPLVKSAMKRLTQQLRAEDRVAIVVYAGSSGLVLNSTPGNQQQDILQALDRLQAGGSTNGGQGIELAYKTAAQHELPGGINRVILCTDGDFNVGVTDRGQLTRLIEEKAKAGIYLTILGFGTGNLQDATMEQLSNHGDGNYAYIDSAREAEKVLVEQIQGTLVTIAKDVKIQVEFNPAAVTSYRLIGYENRLLRKEDFNNDVIDAGDIGSGHTVTALYEVVPTNSDAQPRTAPPVDPLKYQKQINLTDAADTNELLTLKLRYKQPDAPKEQGTSKLISFPVTNTDAPFAQASQDARFAASVAAMGMLLRHSPHSGNATFAHVLDWATDARGEDPQGYRGEFIQLVEQTRALSGQFQTP